MEKIIVLSSIDSWVSSCIKNSNTGNVYHSIGYIICSYPDLVLGMLNYEMNEPSIHDLAIIKIIGDKINSVDEFKRKDMISILEFYKNRKALC